MIEHIAILSLSMGVVLAAEKDPVTNPIYTCKFEAGQIVIEQADVTGEVTVEVSGQARRYVMDKLKLVPRDGGLPSFLFQPDLKRWQWLDNQGAPVESVACTEKQSLKTG